MSTFALKCERFCLRQFYALLDTWSRQLLSTFDHSKYCATCFVWRCEKSERIKIYKMFKMSEVMRFDHCTFGVNLWCEVYPLYVYDNLVVTEWQWQYCSIINTSKKNTALIWGVTIFNLVIVWRHNNTCLYGIISSTCWYLILLYRLFIVHVWHRFMKNEKVRRDANSKITPTEITKRLSCP